MAINSAPGTRLLEEWKTGLLFFAFLLSIIASLPFILWFITFFEGLIDSFIDLFSKYLVSACFMPVLG